MEIISETRNELMNRQELTINLNLDKNPNFADAKKELSTKTKKSEDQIDVYSIKGNFGKKSFEIRAYVYDDAQSLNKAKSIEMTQKQRDANKKAAQEAYKAKKEAEAKPKEESGESS